MAQTALDDLIAIYKEAQLALIKIITGNTGAGTKTYYNTILKQTETLLNRLSAQTGRYIRTEIPKEYKAALDQTYDYFKRNNLRMKRPESFAQVHSDAVSELASEMQHHINEGISSAGRRVMRYADTARDNALRQNGLRASAVKIASGQTVRDMQKDLTQRLSEDGFLTVQYGSGKYAYQVGLDSYAAMVARSTTREAGNLAREKQLTANGYDLVIITEHKPCCEMCARVQGRVFSISGNDKRFPPLSAAFTSGYRNVHPNCSCVAVPWIEELQSPEELRQALEKGSQPLKDERSDAEKALYTQQQSDSRQMRADLVQYQRYKARLGSDAPKSFSAFRRMKNAGGDRWEALQKEYRQRFEKVAEERRELLSRDKVDIAKNAKTTKMAEKASVVESWEAENYKNSTEKGLLILPDGTTKDFGGIEHHVTGKEDDIKLMNGATFTHNHPTDNTFSQNDIVTGIVKGNLKEMRAVTSTGDVHILVNNGATEQQRRKFNVDYQQRRMKAANAADAKIRRGEKINKDEYVKERLEVFMSEHVEEYNLSYTKTRVKSVVVEGGFDESKIISDDIKAEISRCIEKVQGEYNVKVDVFSFEEIDGLKVPFQFVPVDDNGKYKSKFVINKGFNWEESLDKLNERIYNKNYSKGILASQNTEDLIYHEMAHFMTFQECDDFYDYVSLERSVRRDFKAGVSIYSDVTEDGAETIAEAFVRIKNNETVSDDVKELVRIYVERWRK